MNVIRSHLHNVYTEEVNKVALSAEDDKRVIMEDGIHTLAYGHYSLKNWRGRYFLDIRSSWDRQFRESHKCSKIVILFTTYMLRGVSQALNCLSMHATYYMIIAGTSPGQTKKMKPGVHKMTTFCNCGSNNWETVVVDTHTYSFVKGWQTATSTM